MDCFHTIICNAVITEAPSGHLTKSPEVFRSIKAIKTMNFQSVQLIGKMKVNKCLKYILSHPVVLALIYISHCWNVENLAQIETGWAPCSKVEGSIDPKREISGCRSV